ncbi:MAG: hypothetical protein GF408_07980 [Candidatus Omnitrophica bacterium]|nr:hypothetical protein [Candidatus Omnitrophota bacterium]
MDKVKRPNLKIFIITMGHSAIFDALAEAPVEICGLANCLPRRNKGVLGRVLAEKQSRGFLRKICDRQNIPYYEIPAKGPMGIRSRIRDSGADLLVVYSMPRLLSKDVFSETRYGAINLHPSMLPKYRGPNPWFWMYYDYDLNPGVTVHCVDEGEDTGDILNQESFDVRCGIEFSEFKKKAIDEVGVKMLLKTIIEIAEGKELRIRQPETSPTVRARNVEWNDKNIPIDWHAWTVDRVWHFLKGTKPWFDALEGKTFLLPWLKWDPVDMYTCVLKGYNTGDIYKEDGRYFLACSNGKIYLRKILSYKSFFARVGVCYVG